MAALIPYRGRLVTAQQLRSTAEWRRLARSVCQPGAVCHLCGREILYGLRRNHPLSATADHIIAIENGGAPLDPGNVAPAHFGCNSAKQDRDSARIEAWIF